MIEQLKKPSASVSSARPCVSQWFHRRRSSACRSLSGAHEGGPLASQVTPQHLGTGRGSGEVRANAYQEAVTLIPGVDGLSAGQESFEPVPVPVIQPCVPASTEAIDLEANVTNLEDTCDKAVTLKPNIKQTVAEIVSLSLPALGSTLADPVCSLVDTACVGQVSSLQLAALSPCTAIFNFAFLVFQFVGVTLTSKLASNSPSAPGLSSDAALDRHESNKKLVCYSFTFAGIVGVLTSAMLVIAGEPILGMLGTSPAMMAPALQYLTWRALAAPAVLLMNVCQGICLGQQNSLSPLLVFASVGALNVVLDFWMIMGQGMGCAGAAIATAAAQWAGALFFVHYLRAKGKQGTSVPIIWAGFPALPDLQPFMGMASVLLSRTIFSMLAFTIITGAATARGTVAAATHQVCLQLFWFLSYFPEPLSVAAQSLIARDRADSAKALLLTRCIGGMALVLGTVIASACAACFCLSSGAFTSDPAIASAMVTLAAPAGAALFLCAMAMTVDGISIGSDDYRHLPWVNFLGLGATATYLLWCNVQSLSLLHVWHGLVVVFSVRLSVHLVHHLGLNSKTSAIAAAMRREPDGKSNLAWKLAPVSA